MAVTFSGKDKLQKYARFYVAGYDLSGDAVTFSECMNSFEEVDLTGWDEDLKTASGGMREVGISGFQSIFNATTDQSHDRLKAPNTNLDTSVVFGGGGTPAIGDPSYQLPGKLISSNVGLNAGRPLYTGEFRMKTGVSYFLNPLGRCQWYLTEITAAVNGSSTDWGVDLVKTSGASAIIHNTVATSAALSFSIEHSTNDSDWSTLMSFTIDGTSITSEYISTSSTVNRYTRFSSSGTAVTGAQPVVTLAINNVFQAV